MEGFISVSDCCRLYNVDRKTFDSYCKIFNIETKQENNNTYITDKSKEWFDRLFSSYTKEDIKAMMLSKIKPFSCEGITYLSLRKELNLTLKQFINKLSHIGLVLKSNYTKDEENKIREFCSNGMNKAELRELNYVNQGWIPLRKILDEVDVSNGTLFYYTELLNINIYKPLHQISFISKEDREKILNFINEYENSTERKSELIKQTKIERYGTLSISHRYIYNNLNFDSSWELYYYIYNHEILKNDITRGNVFEYEFDGNKRHYECDFLVNNENVEIKGSHYLNENNELIYIYNRDTENFNKMQKLYDAKFNCMKENNVKILTWKDLKDLVKEVQKIYGKDYIKRFKKN